MKPDFTNDELFYIEKLMDINASLTERPMRECAEKLMLSKSMGEKDIDELMSKQFFEFGRAYLVTKKIRDKIEKWRNSLK